MPPLECVRASRARQQRALPAPQERALGERGQRDPLLKEWEDKVTDKALAFRSEEVSVAPQVRSPRTEALWARTLHAWGRGARLHAGAALVNKCTC